MIKFAPRFQSRFLRRQHTRPQRGGANLNRRSVPRSRNFATNRAPHVNVLLESLWIAVCVLIHNESPSRDEAPRMPSNGKLV